MSNRTSINVDKDSHTEASDVKDEYGETWPEVLQWYAEHRPQENADNEDGNEIDAQQIAAELASLIPSLSSAEAGQVAEVETKQIEKRLERIESSVKEATNAAQSADRKIEEMGR